MEKTMESMVKNEEMFIMKDSDPKVEKFWHTGFSEKEPDVISIYGPYINTIVLRKLFYCNDGLSISAWSDAHGDVRGPDHHNHQSNIRVDMEPVNLNLTTDFKDDYNFVLRSGLKFREDKNGLIIALSLNGFLVNHLGSKILKFFKEKINISINDAKIYCRKLDISEEACLNFLRKLHLFGLIIGNDSK